MTRDRRRIASIFTLNVALLAAPVLAAPKNPNSAHARFFGGLWEGIDPVDGSLVQFSVSDVDGDGEYRVLLREGFFFTCLSALNTQGRGLFIGVGEIAERGVLQVEAQRLCINDDNSPAPPEDVEFPLLAVRRDDIVIAPQDEGPDIILHRTSR